MILLYYIFITYYIHLSAAIDFLPETLLESLLDSSELLVVRELVEVSEHTHYFRKPVDLYETPGITCRP